MCVVGQRAREVSSKLRNAGKHGKLQGKSVVCICERLQRKWEIRYPDVALAEGSQLEARNFPSQRP
jgi:hypothetical protein